MPRKTKIESPPLEPKIREASYDILERAFGEYAVKGGTLNDLRSYIEKEIVIKNPKLIDKPQVVLSIVRLLGHRFFEIITGVQQTPNGKEYNRITEKFMEDSKNKYLLEQKSND